MTRRGLSLLFVGVWSVFSLQARDVFVVLSGGVSPFNNNYSQYLQARALNEYFEKHYPRNSVWTFFGAGNIEGQTAKIADVKRRVKRNGMMLDSWLVGPIPHNLPANRDVVLRTFEQEILPAVANGGTIYLFVGDHGSRPNRTGESQIDLWSMKRDSQSANGWRYETNAALGVSDFRRILSARIGKGKLVFCMTQCHSGGFHSMALPEMMIPNRQWFSRGWFGRTPDWAKEKPKTGDVFPFPAVAGFTATDEFSLASGCDPDPDPDGWAGYERFIPENLLGMDLFTREITKPGLRSFADAHVAATLEDFTIDKPTSTSDEYLERWATLLETRLARDQRLTPKVRTALSEYQRVVDGSALRVSDSAFRDKQTQFGKFVERMCEQNSSAKDLLLNGSRRQLESAIGSNPRVSSTQAPPKQPSRTNSPPRRPRSSGGTNSETRKLWRETIQPAWEEIVESGEATNQVSLPLDFEQHLLKLEKEKDRFFLVTGRGLDEEGYWFAGYGKPETVDHARADAISRWTQERRSKILAWAEASDDDDIKAAAKKISARPGRSQSPSPPTTPTNKTLSEKKEDSHKTLGKKTAAERALFYRRVLGAWQFLIVVNERPALERLHELIQLERTPLPPTK